MILLTDSEDRSLFVSVFRLLGSSSAPASVNVLCPLSYSRPGLECGTVNGVNCLSTVVLSIYSVEATCPHVRRHM